MEHATRAPTTAIGLLLISPCTTTSETSPNSKPQQKTDNGVSLGTKTANSRHLHISRDPQELNVATRRCCNSCIVRSWPLTSKDFVDRSFKWRRHQNVKCANKLLNRSTFLHQICGCEPPRGGKTPSPRFPRTKKQGRIENESEPKYDPLIR